MNVQVVKFFSPRFFVYVRSNVQFSVSVHFYVIEYLVMCITPFEWILDMGLWQDRDGKVAFLQKIVSAVQFALNVQLAVRPLKVCYLKLRI